MHNNIIEVAAWTVILLMYIQISDFYLTNHSVFNTESLCTLGYINLKNEKEDEFQQSTERLLHMFSFAILGIGCWGRGSYGAS